VTADDSMVSLDHQCDSGAALQPIRVPETMPTLTVYGTRSHLRLVTVLADCFPGVTMRALANAMADRPRLADAFAVCDLAECRCELQRAGFFDSGPVPETAEVGS